MAATDCRFPTCDLQIAVSRGARFTNQETSTAVGLAGPTLSEPAG